MDELLEWVSKSCMYLGLLLAFKQCSLRLQLNELGQGEYKLTVNDFLIKACAAAMSKVPEVNSSWEGDHIRQYRHVDISMAVSTDRGLITPIIFGADTKVRIFLPTNPSPPYNIWVPQS